MESLGQRRGQSPQFGDAGDLSADVVAVARHLGVEAVVV